MTLPARRRNQAIDVLRGVAILGTLASNIWIFTARHDLPGPAVELAQAHAGLDPTHPEPLAHWRTADGAIALVVDFLANGKFLALLSLLFGVGICAQYESAQRHGYRWPWRYYWRTLLLLLDGLLHHLFVVEFDILMGYAVTAFIVAPLLRLHRRKLLLALATAAAVHLAAEALRCVWAVWSGGETVAHDDAWLELMTATAPTYWSQVQLRWQHFWLYRNEALVIAPPLSATLFLAGAALWRAGLFATDAAARRLQRRLALVALPVGLVLTILPSLELLPPWANLALLSLSRYTIAPVVGLGYLGAGLLLLGRLRLGFVSNRLAEVGRASLSCYMLQNIVASVLFYRWGLALAPLNSVGTMVAWAVLSALVVSAAHLWLRRFSQGPFEAIWRRLSLAPFSPAPRG